MHRDMPQGGPLQIVTLYWIELESKTTTGNK